MPTVNAYFQRVADVLPSIPAEPVERIVGILKDAQANRRRIFMFANGGSSGQRFPPGQRLRQERARARAAAYAGLLPQ